jgi:hypothetical protein
MLPIGSVGIVILVTPWLSFQALLSGEIVDVRIAAGRATLRPRLNGFKRRERAGAA